MTHCNLFLVCSKPFVVLIPDTTSLNAPAQFRRIQDFYISSYIIPDCPISLAMSTNWTISNCTPTCTNAIHFNPWVVVTTYSELFIPARTLDFGLYRLELTVTMLAEPQAKSTVFAYVRINPSGITANLVQFGTSMITRGHEQDLTLDPGRFSEDPDENTFNSTVRIDRCR